MATGYIIIYPCSQGILYGGKLWWRENWANSLQKHIWRKENLANFVHSYRRKCSKQATTVWLVHQNIHFAP